MTAGFGLEKLGFLTARYPRATLLIILATLPMFLFFAARLEFSSDIREIFRSDSQGFEVLEEVSRQYPGADRDVLLVLESDDIFKPEALSAIQFLQLDLSLVEDVKYVLTIFSARKLPDAQGNAVPVIPPEITPETDLEAVRKQILAHPLVSGKLLSPDSKTTLVVVAFKQNERTVHDIAKAIDEVTKIADPIIKEAGLTYQTTGIAAMRVEIIGALARDQSRFALAGLFLGLGLCWFFFRRWAYVFMAGTPALVAVIWLAGCMSMVGQEVNVLTNVIPVLVVVLVFSDALHILFGIRHNIADGHSLDGAIALAVKEVGPACVLTSATTTLALLSLTLVRHEFISSFGLTAALGTGLAYGATIALVPALAAIFLKRTPRKRPKDAGEYWFGRAATDVSSQVGQMVVARPYAIAAAGFMLTILFGGLYASNESRYSYQENLPKGNPAFEAIKDIDENLGGSNLMRLMIQWPKDYDIKQQRTLDLIRKAHEALRAEPQLLTITSLVDIEDWLRNEGQKDLFGFLEKSKTQLGSRMFSTEHNSALLTAQFRAINSRELIPVLEDLEKRLNVLRAKNPDVKFYLTGLVPLSARASTEMITRLNQSLAMAIGVIIFLIGFAMRSLVYGLASIAPNLLPIAAGGTFLFLTGHGLQFTSVIAFTVAFGIAVDSTIHVLNRYRIERTKKPDVSGAVKGTLTAIGPVLIVATIVLISGVVVTIISEMPTVQLYGEITSIVLLTALVGAMVFLPAILYVVDTWMNAPETAPSRGRAPRARTQKVAR
jgi:predicted RND superfamily exporter protein